MTAQVLVGMLDLLLDLLALQDDFPGVCVEELVALLGAVDTKGLMCCLTYGRAHGALVLINGCVPW